MIDELYDDVLSVMKEHGFVDWFYNNHRGKVSPLKWCGQKCLLSMAVHHADQWL